MNSLYDWSETRKIGVGMTAFGSLFFGLGVVMFLDSAMLTLGNLLFVGGVVLVMGPQNAQAFLFEPKRRRASGCFFVGILLVMCGWCFFGLLIQGFGGLNLFGNFFPIVVRVLETLPVVGNVIRTPAVQAVLQKLHVISEDRRNV